MARRPALRASDLDREHIAERLRNATAEGRLLASELEDRLGSAFSARTYGELDALVADLPVVREREERRTALPVRLALVAAAAMAVVVVMTLLTLIVLGIAGAWLAWMFLAWMFFGRRGWPGRYVGGSRTYGSAYRGAPRRGRPPRSGQATLL